MLRCDNPVGKYRVTFEWRSWENNIERPDVIAHIGLHEPVYQYNDQGQKVSILEDIPRLQYKKPYIGELCEHELHWCTTAPGFIFSPHWRFTLKEQK